MDATARRDVPAGHGRVRRAATTVLGDGSGGGDECVGKRESEGAQVGSGEWTGGLEASRGRRPYPLGAAPASWSDRDVSL